MEENKKKPIRIGKITFGVILILVGIAIFVQTLTSLNILRYVLMLWPLVLICLGIETLVYRNKEYVKYDIWGGIFTLIIIFTVSIFSMGNYVVNKLLYNKNIQSVINEYTSNVEFETTFNNSLLISNAKANEKVHIKINEVPFSTDINVKIKVNLAKEPGNEISFVNSNIYDYIFVNHDNNEVTLLDTFENYENIEITIVAPTNESISIK